MTARIDPLISVTIWVIIIFANLPNDYKVPKARIAEADINGSYLEAVIKIRTSNAYLVPEANPLSLNYAYTLSAVMRRRLARIIPIDYVEP